MQHPPSSSTMEQHHGAAAYSRSALARSIPSQRPPREPTPTLPLYGAMLSHSAVRPSIRSLHSALCNLQSEAASDKLPSVILKLRAAPPSRGMEKQPARPRTVHRPSGLMDCCRTVCVSRES
jgi:hypothetical protein